MKKLDILAAQLFALPLSEETKNALKSNVLRMAKKGDEKPDPATRRGLALIAFSTPAEYMYCFDELNDEEEMEILQRVKPLWTEEEKDRLPPEIKALL